MKRIISLFLTLLLLLNVVAVSVSATEIDATESTAVETETSVEIIDETMLDTEIVDETEESSDNVVEVELATESYEYDKKEAPAQTGASNVLNFDATTAGWKNYKKVFCHIWVYGGDSFYSWQSRAEACTDSDGDGIWTYDLDAKNVPLESGTLYVCIFSNENCMQTYNLLFDTNVLGDTAYCDGTVYENPEDSSMSAQAAFWRGQNPYTYGPQKCITSIGNVIGTCMPYTTTPRAMFIDFLKYNLEIARTYSGKTDQELIDDIGKALRLNVNEVNSAIVSSKVSISWKASKSKLPSGSAEDDPPFSPGVESSIYAVTLNSIDATTTGAKITWSKNAYDDGYYVYRKTATSNWSKIKTITSYKTTSYTDTTAKSGTTYFYAIVGYYGSNKFTSEHSNIVQIKFMLTPTISSITSTNSGLKVSWKKVSNVTGYEIYRKGSNEDIYKKIATVKGAVNVSYNDKSVKNGITYRYSIKAYKSSQKSAFSSTKAFDPKAKSEMRLAKNGTRTLSLSAIKSKKYYYSSNKSIFTVNSKGKITAKASGKATLTVKAKGVYAKTTILVSSPKVTLSASKTKIYRGYSTTIKAVSYPDNVKISWKTSNSKVATVSSSGKVTGKGKGTATITASIKYNGKTYKKSVKITVVCQKPSIYTLMTKSQSYSPYVAIQIVNTGKKTLRINKTGGKCMGNSMILCAVKDDKIVDLKYVDIKPGAQYVALFRTKSNKSILYTRDTSLTFSFTYDGLNYTLKTSSKYNYI